LAKGRASNSSPAAVHAHTLELQHPQPNQRVYGISDAAGDGFLLLKYVLLLLLLLLLLLFLCDTYFSRFIVRGGKEGDGLVLKLFVPAENR
jgi:hypothetical protein